jgi:hypothetical protein
MKKRSKWILIIAVIVIAVILFFVGLKLLSKEGTKNCPGTLSSDEICNIIKQGESQKFNESVNLAFENCKIIKNETNPARRDINALSKCYELDDKYFTGVPDISESISCEIKDDSVDIVVDASKVMIIGDFVQNGEIASLARYENGGNILVYGDKAYLKTSSGVESTSEEDASSEYETCQKTGSSLYSLKLIN